jgi:chromosome segregation ATPase
MSEERKTLEKKLQAQEGFFQNTLHQFARALGLPNTRSATEAQAIQEAIYRLKRSEKELSEINKDMKATIKTQKQTIQIMEEKNRMLEENQKEQIDSINKKEKAIQDLNTQCTKLASDLQDVSEKAATAEAKNMRLSTELEASSERVKTLENALKNEQDASEEFKQKTQDVIAKLSKEYEKTLQEVVEKTKKTTEEALSDLFSRNKNSGSSSDQSPKTVRKSSMFGILGLFC